MQPRQPLNSPKSFIFSFIILYFVLLFVYAYKGSRYISYTQTKTQINIKPKHYLT
nr:MAG TPA: hypothetical protein [Bacteriophage sp.]